MESNTHEYRIPELEVDYAIYKAVDIRGELTGRWLRPWHGTRNRGLSWSTFPFQCHTNCFPWSMLGLC